MTPPHCSLLQVWIIGEVLWVSHGKWWRLPGDGGVCSAAWEDNSAWMVWLSAPTQLSLLPHTDACGAAASCLAEGCAAARPGCKAPQAAGMGLWPQTQLPLAVPLPCVKTLFALSQKVMHKLLFHWRLHFLALVAQLLCILVLCSTPCPVLQYRNVGPL